MEKYTKTSEDQNISKRKSIPNKELSLFPKNVVSKGIVVYSISEYAKKIWEFGKKSEVWNRRSLIVTLTCIQVCCHPVDHVFSIRLIF